MSSSRNNFYLCLTLVFVTLAVEVAVSTTNDDVDEFEIKSLSGEPNYRSVNLTWEIEYLNIDMESSNYEKQQNFTVYYCEIQTWGPNRCKSKYYIDNEIRDDLDDDDYATYVEGNDKHYSLMIDNLRMATKYSFHVKKMPKFGEQKISARDFNEDDLETNEISESIIIPTKGFSAHATKCLAHASEIEVETGPYFGGKIGTENGDCGINGDPKSSQEVYIMQIDHLKCGSKVHHSNLTVETFITVQENMGIFTHSTRRFMVLCTYHPEMLTVRASFTVPGKGGVQPIAPDFHETGRNARERHFRLVDKSALVLKENDSGMSRDSGMMEIEEMKPQTTDELQRSGRRLDENLIEKSLKEKTKTVHFSRLVDERQGYDEHIVVPEAPPSSYTSTPTIFLGVSLTIIMCGAFVFVVKRELIKQQGSTKILDSVRIVDP